jgi:hypothetical protein
VDPKDLKFKIEVADDGYQLTCGDEESGVTDYGSEATIEVDGITYGVVVEDGDDAKTALVYQYLDNLVPEVEETEFDLDDYEDAEDEAEEEEGGVPA